VFALDQMVFVVPKSPPPHFELIFGALLDTSDLVYSFSQYNLVLPFPRTHCMTIIFSLQIKISLFE
jgi:hypothetical protein